MSQHVVDPFSGKVLHWYVGALPEGAAKDRARGLVAGKVAAEREEFGLGPVAPRDWQRLHCGHPVSAIRKDGRGIEWCSECGEVEL